VGADLATDYCQRRFKATGSLRDRAWSLHVMPPMSLGAQQRRKINTKEVSKSFIAQNKRRCKHTKYKRPK